MCWLGTAVRLERKRFMLLKWFMSDFMSLLKDCVLTVMICFDLGLWHVHVVLGPACVDFSLSSSWNILPKWCGSLLIWGHIPCHICFWWVRLGSGDLHWPSFLASECYVGCWWDWAFSISVCVENNEGKQRQGKKKVCVGSWGQWTPGYS